MNITKENPNELTAIIKMELKPEDYQPKVDESLKKYQRTANIPGFRPGKVPVGVIKKMYGKSVMVDELNRITANELSKYIFDNKLEVIGSPLPKKTEKEMSLTEGESFEFLYEVGIAPQFEVALSSKDKLPYYLIKVDEKMVTDDVDDLRRRYGKFSNPEVSSDTNILYGEFVELDETGNPKPEGNTTTTTLSIAMIKDAIDRNQFVGLKKDDAVTFNPVKVLGNETEVSAMLKVDKSSPALHSDYRMTVKTINQVDKAEMNEELFNKVYGEGEVKTEEEFRQRVKDGIAAYFVRESDKKLKKDLKNYLFEKLEIPLPDDFLKRMVKSNMDSEKPLNDQEFEHEYFHLAEELRWDLIKQRVAKTASLEVDPEEVKNLASAMVRQQFAQYGMYQMEDDKLQRITEDYVQKEENRERLEKSILEDKVFRHLKTMAKLDTEELPYDVFMAKMAEKTEHENAHH